MATFSLGKHPHVELCDLLKLEGWSESCCLIPFPACINRPVLFSDFCPLRPVHPC